MKQHMLRQIPGYDMLMLPPFDTQRELSEDYMDHLVTKKKERERIAKLNHTIDLLCAWYACHGI